MAARFGLLGSATGLKLSAKIYLIVFLAFVGAFLITLQASFISRENLEASKAKELEHLVDVGMTIFKRHYARVKNGEVSSEEAFDKALREIETLRYGSNGYYVMLSYKGIVVGHGPKPKLIGVDMYNVADANGVLFTKELVTVAQNPEGGVVNYLFPLPGGDKPVRKMVYSKGFAPWKVALSAGAYLDDVDATYWANMRTLLSSAAAILAVIVLVSVVVALSIVRPMKAITEAMRALSNGNLDVKIFYKERTDEIGDMSRALRVFRNNAREKAELSEQQAELKAKSEAEQRQMLLTMADQFDDGVQGILNEVSQAMSKLSSETDTLADRAKENTNRAGQISTAMGQATTNVANVAGASEEMTCSLTEIATQVDLSSNVSKTAVDEVQKATEVVATLSDASQAIGKIVSLIQDIAEQTNLLALNATIEAARAGEAGKGFAVVASEVKELASQTGKATDEISSQINSIQSNISNAVEVISHVESTIDKISGISSAIAAAVEEQGVASGEISSNITRAASFSQEVSDNAEILKNLAGDNGQSASAMSKNAHELQDQFDNLLNQVEVFLSSIRDQHDEKGTRAA